MSGAPTFTLGRETPLREGRPDGIFARWAWDGRQLQLENDRYGLQPLYYFSDKGRCALSPSVSKRSSSAAERSRLRGARRVPHLGYFLDDETSLPRHPGRAAERELPVVAGSPDSRGPEAASGAGPPRPRRGSRRVRGQLPGSDPAAAARERRHRPPAQRRARPAAHPVRAPAQRACAEDVPDRRVRGRGHRGGARRGAGARHRARGGSRRREDVRRGAPQERAHELLRRRAHLGAPGRGLPRATAHDALRRARRGRAVRGPFPVAQAPAALRGRPLPGSRTRPLGRQRGRSDVPPRHARKARERCAPFEDRAGAREHGRASPVP